MPPMLVGLCFAGLRGSRKPGDQSTANSRARAPLPGAPAAKKWLAETYTANLPSNRLAHCPPSTKSFLLRASQAGALAKQSLMLAQTAVSVQVLLIGMQG